MALIDIVLFIDTFKTCCLQSELGSVGSAPLSPIGARRSHDEYGPLQLHGGIRRLQRTLSEDNKRRRDSMPSTPLGHPPLGVLGIHCPPASPSPLSHSEYSRGG